ncbi:hypothetical protein U3A58_02495 [Algoriphagus sp. C2-6-M1]|uniref:hypothetical protein n=1 Tax=Algoriphagus persicinus TaxID=3108754 RepID=UPI002B3A328D|nr:hypothetical protein [Algoriphagus sp. C2-6-M1]MEB2779248.1 hypothetical protein [Algoriphagus sp. C2-6-M1]
MNCYQANCFTKELLNQRISSCQRNWRKGNGTARIFAKNPDVFTFSMYGKKNYPMRKDVSDLDCAIADSTTDDLILGLFNPNLKLF